MYRYTGVVFDSEGNPLDGVTVTVKKAGTAVNASLFSDDGITTKANGFTNDADGSFEFYAPNGRYDIVYTKTGIPFTGSNSTDLILYDPRDDMGAVMFKCDFLSAYITGSDLIADGHHWRIGAGLVQRVAGDATYRNGFIDVLEAAGAQGSLFLADNANALQLNWAVGSDLMVLELRPEKVGVGVAGTRRIGLGGAALASGDPTNGIYVRQIDANNAFLVCRNGGTESTQDLGVTLNAMKNLRVTIVTGSVRAFVDGVAKTPITTNIPTAVLGASIGGGATASAAGLRTDFFNVVSGARI